MPNPDNLQKLVKILAFNDRVLNSILFDSYTSPIFLETVANYTGAFIVENLTLDQFIEFSALKDKKSLMPYLDTYIPHFKSRLLHYITIKFGEGVTDVVREHYGYTTKSFKN